MNYEYRVIHRVMDWIRHDIKKLATARGTMCADLSWSRQSNRGLKKLSMSSYEFAGSTKLAR